MLRGIATKFSRPPYSLVFVGKRNFWQYLIGSFNMYDPERVKEVGPDRAAAEWLLKNGAFVRWQGQQNVVKDYNQIGVSGGRHVEAIDCTDSSVSGSGFQHLKGLQHVREVKLVKCWNAGNAALHHIAEFIPHSLQHLEVVSCAVSNEGLLAIRNCKALKIYRVGNLPNVDDLAKVVDQLKNEMPQCQLEHITQVDDSHKKKRKSVFSIFSK